MPRKDNPVDNVFEGQFSDSDDNNEDKIDISEEDINYRVQERQEQVLRSFKEFINVPDYITTKGDPKTNVVDRYFLSGENFTAKTFCIPDEKIDKMFKYMDVCRRKNIKLMMYEKQLDYSGIMIDFDIYQVTENSKLERDIIYPILRAIIMLLTDYLDLDVVNPFSIYMAVVAKPKPLFSSEKKCFKDGFHIIIPSIKVNRETKRFLIHELISKDYFAGVFTEFDPIEGITYNDFIDKNSAHVPVHFLGSSTKNGHPPYILKGMFKYDVIKGAKNFVIRDAPEFKADKVNDLVLCHELSVNWEKKGGVIKKQTFLLKEEYLLQASKFKGSVSCVEDEIGIASDNSDLAVLKLQDPDVEYIIKVVDTLDIRRSIDYYDWFRVLCALAHTNKAYRPIAEYFSQKCVDKYSPESFRHFWELALQERDSKLHIGSLHYWARMDNPERYEVVRSDNVFSLIYKKIFDTTTEGNLQHYDIAQILSKVLLYKYAYDPSGYGIWYEFILPEDSHNYGEVYKWRVYTNKPPLSIKRYISEILPKMFKKVLDKIQTLMENKSEKNAKYMEFIKKNFQSSIRNLRNGSFKNGVSSESEQVFEKVGFSRRLDTDPEILGVGNGILVLGETCRLITGYHTYLVSKFTDVDYIPFNPRNPTTKKLLIVLRNLFADDEPDSFDFMMHYFASALDGRIKESLLILLVGAGKNGKSFLIELFRSVIGNEFAVKMNMSFLTSRQKNSENATPALMALKGARFVYYSETQQIEVLNCAKVKEITGQENLGGRKNYGDYINFKPTCHHLVTSNYDFIVPSMDEGTWRRLYRVPMKIKFCQENVDQYEENNPYERIADPNIQASWPSSPEVKSAFLSILVYYNESLWRNYQGLLLNVPHPTIKHDTEMFRNRQDKINNFISERLVKTDDTFEMPMTSVIDKYIRWHDVMYPDEREFKKNLNGGFENSKIHKLIIKSNTGNYLRGYRILGDGEQLSEGEIFFIDSINTKQKQKIKLNPETAEQFWERVCNDFDLYQINKERAIELERKRRIILSKEIKEYDDNCDPIEVKEYKNHTQKKSNITIETHKYNSAGYRIQPTQLDLKELNDPDEEVVDVICSDEDSAADDSDADDEKYEEKEDSESDTD